MSPRLAISLTLLSFLGLGCVVPFAAPPMKVDIGGARAARPSDGNVVHVAMGVHSASLGSHDPEQDRYDVGVGFVVDSQGGAVRSQGAYAAADWFVSRSQHARMSLGLRTDLLFTDRGVGSGLFGRVGGEFFTPVAESSVSSGPCDHTWRAIRGTPAIGVYADAGVQLLPEGRTALVVTGGVTFRIPAFGMLALVIPSCH